MNTPITHVLSDEVEIDQEDEPVLCCDCLDTATIYWPASSDNAKPYCSSCLSTRKQQLVYALGLR